MKTMIKSLNFSETIGMPTLKNMIPTLLLEPVYLQNNAGRKIKRKYLYWSRKGMKY
jgi:hypothetical protein